MDRKTGNPETPGNLLLKKYLANLAKPGTAVPANPNFSMDTLNFIDQNSNNLSKRQLVDAARALKLNVGVATTRTWPANPPSLARSEPPIVALIGGIQLPLILVAGGPVTSLAAHRKTSVCAAIVPNALLLKASAAPCLRTRIDNCETPRELAEKMGLREIAEMLTVQVARLR